MNIEFVYEKGARVIVNGKLDGIISKVFIRSGQRYVTVDIGGKPFTFPEKSSSVAPTEPDKFINPNQSVNLPDVIETWEDVKALLYDEESKSIVESLSDLNIALPSAVGFEIENNNGEIIGEAELAWVEKKIALLLPSQTDCTDSIAAEKWTVFCSADGIPYELLEDNIQSKNNSTEKENLPKQYSDEEIIEINFSWPEKPGLKNAPETWRELIDFASVEKRPLTYNELKHLIQNKENRTIAAISLRFPLGYIRDNITVPNGLPLLNMLVVNQTTGLPGESALPDGRPLTRDNWEEYLEEVFAYPWERIKLVLFETIDADDFEETIATDCLTDNAYDIEALKATFVADLIDGVKTCKKLGYNPSYFLRMVDEMGGFEAAKTLINVDNPSTGFTKLWEMKRLDLSVEYCVLKSEYSALFSTEELKKCNDRLDAYNFDWTK
ncbi:MAG: hypothetical protein LBN34_06475 [Clostridiales Family XIII bacterium]|nr:hypothetical protein [Clostridiales Family XIII bacterium]